MYDLSVPHMETKRLILREMDMNTISPLMAFGTLQNLVDKVQKK